LGPARTAGGFAGSGGVRHGDVAEDGEVVVGSEGFECGVEDLFGSGGGGLAVVTVECDEVEVAFVLETLEAWGFVPGDGQGRSRCRAIPTHDEKMS
jgi:hypothetical protein